MKKNSWKRYFVAAGMRTFTALALAGIAVGVTALVAPASLAIVGFFTGIVTFSGWFVSLVETAKEYSQTYKGRHRGGEQALTKLETKFCNYLERKYGFDKEKEEVYTLTEEEKAEIQEKTKDVLVMDEEMYHRLYDNLTEKDYAEMRKFEEEKAAKEALKTQQDEQETKIMDPKMTIEDMDSESDDSIELDDNSLEN